MRALVLDGQLKSQSDYPDVEPRPGESIVKVLMAGICGTDLELARGYMTYRGVLGHEFVGEVVESADARLTGRRVVGEINAGCGHCDLCLAAMERHCPHRTVLGILGRDGCFAEYLRLPDRNLLAVPGTMADEVAVFTEPVAAACEILEQTRIARNATIAVLGDGRLGAIAAMVLKANDYAAVVGGHHHEKLARLNEIGIAGGFEADLRPGLDVVIDCTGASAGFARAIELVRPRGTIVLKSTAAAAASLNLAPRLNDIVVNEISVVGSRCGRFAPALDTLASGKLDVTALISAVYPLEDGIAAFAAAADPSNLKVLLKLS